MALDQGNLERSIAHCRRAIERDPSNAAAHNDLGVLLLTAGRSEDALTEFARATAVNPNFAAALIHASYAALALGRAGIAEDSARRAIELDRRNHRAHLLLGWSLARQGKYTADALQSLRIAEREFPEARLAAADVLAHRGSFDAAREEVEEYLKSPNPEHQQLAAAWLRILTLN